MYVCGMVIPVPEGRMEDYRRWAEKSAAFFKEYGCLETVDAWEDNVPSGKQTDFRRAVAAEEGEKIVFCWQVWPDKATLDAAEARMHLDPRMDVAPDDIPFDPRRLILGGFQALFTMGRS